MINVGQRLKDERVRRGLTLDDISKKTKIRVSFLQAIEKNDYKRLPSSAYIQGFVKNYAAYLGFPPKEFAAFFRREFNEQEYVRVLPEGFAAENRSLKKFRPGPKTFGLVTLFLLLVGYIFYQYRYAFIDLPLEVTSPIENQVVSTSLLVSGKTEPSAVITINNLPANVERSGEFKKNISLFPGRAIITVKVSNRFGKETVVERIVEVKE